MTPPLRAQEVTTVVLDDETERLRALHDQYVWEVNAAIAEGRGDLVAQLVADYPGCGSRGSRRLGQRRVPGRSVVDRR